MAEELAKYKQILEREDREFHEVMSSEVSTFLSSGSSRRKGRTLTGHMLLPILHWILQFSFRWCLTPFSPLFLHYVVLGLGFKFKQIQGGFAFVWEGSRAETRKGMPCLSLWTRACGLTTMSKNTAKNWTVLTQTNISGYCLVHCVFCNCCWYEIKHGCPF